MSLALQSLALSASAVDQGGGTVDVTVIVSNPPDAIELRGTDQYGHTAEATVIVNPENWTTSTDASLIVNGKAPPGMVVVEVVSGPGSVAASGQAKATVTAD